MRKNNIVDICNNVNGACVAFGRFDGVHRGHRAVIDRLALEAQSCGLTPVLLLNADPGYCELLLSPEDETALILRRSNPGIAIYMLPAGVMSSMAPEAFIKDILVAECNAKKIVAGNNCKYGSGGEGGAGTLASLSHIYGFEAIIVNPLNDGAYINGTNVALAANTGNTAETEVLSINMALCDAKSMASCDAKSMASCEAKNMASYEAKSMASCEAINAGMIRNALAAADIARANWLLAGPYVIRGTVVPGNRLGRKSNMPTANIKTPPNKFLPAHGVYAVTVSSGGIERIGIMHIGRRPTVESTGNVTVEVHILEFTGDLYGHEIEASLHMFIRGTRKFNSLDEVKAQVDLDIVKTMDYFHSHGMII